MTIASPQPDKSADYGHMPAVRVYQEDTDAGSFVDCAYHLEFVERSRTDFPRLAGADHPALQRKHGPALTAGRCKIEYFAPAPPDDRIEVHT